MDKNDLLISLIDRVAYLYDEIADSNILDPVEVEGALEYLTQFREELEALVE